MEVWMPVDRAQGNLRAFTKGITTKPLADAGDHAEVSADRSDDNVSLYHTHPTTITNNV